MKNFIENILGIIVFVIALVIVLAIGVGIFALIVNNGGDVLTGVGGCIITITSVSDWLANLKF